MSGSILITRALIALTIMGAGIILYRLANRVILLRAQKNSQSGSTRQPILLHGVPAILYFTTPECVACKAIQRPVLQHLQDQLGSRLEVIEVNAAERPDLAGRWGVLSVPTTFIIDEQGQLRHVNHGVARADKLLQQLDGILSNG